MAEKILKFYEALADHYHLIFDDWNGAIERQAKVLGVLLASQTSVYPLKVLDCACGIGTQAIGFAAMGHHVVASDLSPAEVKRAQYEAQCRSLRISFYVSDMTSLMEVPENEFDVVAALDNALPHLTIAQLGKAAGAIASKLKPKGLFIASIRDYDKLILQKPTIQEPAFFGTHENRRIVHQIWDWIDDTRYVVHLYITAKSDREWVTHHFVSEYRCVLRDELSGVLRNAGFGEIEWLMPAEGGFYQPLLLARLPG
ncbi:MAG TPA: class I SAM-dependent methyltransferase [Edaphobacter sp.]|uniref:class I SAM-dependent methyltransferase n=1 Tax=Edaphobacter sp. TaxID=1934404 RepID=UPI002BED26A6|nr:class I SAM-dependent methyltransferase [Edaphobacter sp.]HUZ93871.1 class I SAM-dependent methyltransferase [Edaphobacter sp.]